METEAQQAPAAAPQTAVEGRAPFRTTIGGQALIEGIMMQGPLRQAMVVRNPEGGLEVQVEERSLIAARYPILGKPFIRGCVNFYNSIVKGVSALAWSAEFYPEEELSGKEPGKWEQFLERAFGSEKAMKLVTAVAVALGVVFTMALFVFLPTLLTGGLLYFTPHAPLWLRNLLEGVVKVVIFLVYLYACSHMKDIKRTFCYHGAEHKAIFCYERGEPLTVEKVREMPRFHPRCGTSFLFVVLIVSILVSALVFALPPVREGAANAAVRIGVHLVLLPVVVSLTYELHRLVGRSDGYLARTLTAPGLWLQRFTCFEPDDEMIEVAIEALTLVLPEEQGADRW